LQKNYEKIVVYNIVATWAQYTVKNTKKTLLSKET